MAILIVCVLIRTSGRGHHLRRRIKAIVDSLNLESSFDLSDEEESDRESNVNDPHSEKERQFNDLVTFTHDSDFIEEVSVSLDNSDHASDFSAESDSYGDKSEDEDNFWEDVDILDDPFTEESNLERQQREMGKKLANWAATGNIPRTQVNELLKLLRSNAGLMYLPLTLKNSFKNS